MERVCANTWCKQSFAISDRDRDFYEKVSPVINGKKYPISLPTLCPTCRLLRRSSWRNERSLHARTCDRCDKKIITLYHPGNPFPVYCHSCWWGDQWEPKNYGQKLDLNRSFLEQFFEVNHRTPHLAMMNDNGVNSENCEYTTDFSFGKNCYMSVGSWFVENCYYLAASCTRGKFLVDSYLIADSEICYECLDSRRLYNCRYLQNCEACHDCIFGYDLKGCSNCVGCYGLRQKQFCWFNEQLSKEDYRKRLAAFDVGSYKAVEEMKARFKQEILILPRRGMQLVNCEDCDGDYLNGCHDTHNSFMIFDAQHCRYCDKGEGQISSYDLLHVGTCEYCYEGLTPDNSYMTLFSMWTWFTKYCRYSDNCHHSEHLFGCSSIKSSKFCILNKQYSEEEYMTLAPKIIERMKSDGEWGELFPTSCSPFGYNETMAQDYVPLTKEQVTAKGWKWIEPQSDDKDGTLSQELPDRIDDASDAILTTPIRCIRSGRVFRMIKQETDFYKQHRIPLPRLHPTERHQNRFRSHNFPELHDRQCANCSKSIRTTYAPDRPEIIYCDECYLKTVY